jgi:hypothetical protein
MPAQLAQTLSLVWYMMGNYVRIGSLVIVCSEQGMQCRMCSYDECCLSFSGRLDGNCNLTTQLCGPIRHWERTTMCGMRCANWASRLVYSGTSLYERSESHRSVIIVVSSLSGPAVAQIGGVICISSFRVRSESSNWSTLSRRSAV